MKDAKHTSERSEWVCLAILHNELIIKIVQTSQPWSNLFILCALRSIWHWHVFKYKETSSNKNRNFIHQDIFITVHFLRNFVQCNLYILYKRFNHVLKLKMSQNNGIMFKFTHILWRHFEKYVNKLLSKIGTTIFQGEKNRSSNQIAWSQYTKWRTISISSIYRV